jgi:hypothetical protein
MGALDGNIWVCGECRSINNEGAKQCYNCRTPRERAAVDPATIDPSSHGKLREIALPAFHSPRPFAALASILILATAGMQVVYTLDFSSLLLQTLGGTAATDEQVRFMGTIGLVTVAVSILALVAWSLWLSRAVTAMPALGLGYPAATGLTAFVENFLPGLNLLRVPAIVRDVVRRVEPGSYRGEALIFAAWIGLIGGFVVPRVFGLLNGLTAETEDAALRTQLTIQGVAIGLVLVGAVFLVWLIWWIEERISRRRQAQLAAIDVAAAGGTDEPAEANDEGVDVRYPTPRVHEPAPSTPAWMWKDTSDSPLAATGEAGGEASISGPGWDPEPPIIGMPVPPPLPVSSPPPAPVAGPPPVPMAGPSSATVAEPMPVDQPSPIAAPEPAPVDVPAAVAYPAPVADPETPAVSPEPAATRPETAAPSRSEPAAVPVDDGAPHLTIRVVNHGMLQAELNGEQEPVILEDLAAYGSALANVGGTAEIVVTGSDDMARLIARRAQRIMADAGIEATIPE